MAADQAKKPLSYGLLLFPQFEVLDAAGPIETLNVLSFQLDHQEIKLSVIAESLDPVGPGAVPPDTKSLHFNGQQKYLPTHTFETAPQLDVLIVPGGRGTQRPNADIQPMLDFIRNSYRGENGRDPLKYIFSICTGSALLARAGVLDGHKATTNKKAWARVTPEGPKTHWIARARWVTSGNVWTSSGVSAGTDGMVAFIGAVYGDDVADRVCDVIEYERVKDSGDDPFADSNGCKDLPPVK